MDNESTLTIDKYETSWWLNKKGQQHRIDGPSLITKNGYKQWRINGCLHREDGPSVIFPGGEVQWWINHVRYGTKEAYFDALSDESKKKCLFSEDFLNG
jgi:hypothetical protein